MASDGEGVTEASVRWQAGAAAALLLLTAMIGWPAASRASGFPHIPVWAVARGFEDGSHFKPDSCVGVLTPPADSLIARGRTVTIRFLRDRRAEARPDFGGYRVWRAVNSPDTSRMVLIRRFSKNSNASLTWNFSSVDATTLEFMCQGEVVHDSVVTVVDPDSSGNFVKDCRVVDRFGRCVSRGDSVFMLVSPPGPHDGFLTWYSVTYEAQNIQDNVNLDLFVPGPYDTSNGYANCGTPGDSTTCPRINLNNKLANMIAQPVVPTPGRPRISAPSAWCRTRSAAPRPGISRAPTRSTSSTCRLRRRSRSTPSPGIWWRSSHHDDSCATSSAGTSRIRTGATWLRASTCTASNPARSRSRTGSS